MKKILFFSFSFLACFPTYLPGRIFAHGINTLSIEMHKDSFYPGSITIEQGEEVVFKNVDSQDHWLASNIHPTHQVYPEFDPLRPIKPGESWSFTFTKAGEWKYHDHLNPHILGTIIVKGENKTEDMQFSFKKFFQDFKPQLDKTYYSIFPKKLDKAVSSINMFTVVKNFDEARYWLLVLGGKRFMQRLIHDSGGGSLVDCHREAHTAGRIGYELLGAAVFRDGTSDCHSGYYHGAMEVFLKEKGTGDLSKNIKKLCNVFKTNFGIFECLHGVGHGVAAYEGYNIPLALKTCGKLKTVFEKRSCYGGVFMENIVASQGNGAKQDHVTHWVNMNPQFPCSGIDTDRDIQEECYKMQTTRMFDLLHRDFSLVSRECTKAPYSYRATCFQSLGRDAAGHTLRDPEKIIAICNKVPFGYFDICISGAFNVIVDFWGEGLGNQAENMCRQLSSDSSKKYCYGLLGSRLKNVFGANNEKIRFGCNESLKQYRSVCLDSASKN